MRRTAIMLAGFIILLSIGATAQENRSEISVQGTGFFTQDTNGQGISRTTTETGGFLVGCGSFRFPYFCEIQGQLAGARAVTTLLFS